MCNKLPFRKKLLVCNKFPFYNKLSMCNKQPFHNKLHIFNKFRVCNIHSNSHSGGILIEFAFSIPILIILLLFACDHYRFYELKDKVKSSTYLAASMIQQLGNTRTDKQLTIDDFARITYASGLNFFHTDTMFSHVFGIYYLMYFFYVKRDSENSYQFQSGYTTTSLKQSENTLLSRLKRFADKTATGKTKSYIESIHSDLVCEKDGEERVFSWNVFTINMILTNLNWDFSY